MCRSRPRGRRRARPDWRRSFPQPGPVQVQADLTHLAFEVDDMEAFGQHLKKLGLKFSDGPTASSSGSVFAFIDAPEGYEIELVQMPKS